MKNKRTIIHYLTISLSLFSYSGITAQEIGDEFENLKNQKYEVEKYKAAGGNIFVGYGLLNGNISEYFTNPFFIGINVDFIRQKMVIQIDDFIGFGRTKKTMEFPNDLEWSKNKVALHFVGGGNFGFRLFPMLRYVIYCHRYHNPATFRDFLKKVEKMFYFQIFFHLLLPH